jgi:hypothetical protein
MMRGGPPLGLALKIVSETVPEIAAEADNAPSNCDALGLETA